MSVRYKRTQKDNNELRKPMLEKISSTKKWKPPKEPNKYSGAEEQMDEIKTAIESFNNQTEDRMCELEDRSHNTTLSEKGKQIRIKKGKESLCELWDSMK